ncbi:MAG TPA: carboxypeptidase regulatory-like domain-containing protein [Thermoanaerobaculia bacterium]|nr:carboxypeptidase regulatory-like domain-containing protein [Thermoanaerobaculia bacterium]
MSRGNRHILFLSLVVGIALSHASFDAWAAVLGPDHRLRAEFPAIGQLIGITSLSSGSPRSRSVAAETSGLRGFEDRFAEGYRIEIGNTLVVLRPELSRGSIRSVTASGTAYTDAFPGVDVLRTAAGGTESEVLFVENASDAAAIAYRVTTAAGVLEIVNNDRGIRFVTGNGSDAFLSAPMTIDSSGRLSYDARWEVDRSDRGAVATLRLRIRDQKLKYPIGIVYSPGHATLLRQPQVAASAGAVTGTVTQSGGGAVSAALVFLYDSSGDTAGIATTDGAGHYSITGLLTDNYRALASADNYVPQLYNNIDCLGFACSPLDGTPFAVADGSTTSGINFALHSNAVSLATITGRVTGPAAAPLQDVTVVLYDTSGVPTASSSTDADGQYQITLDHGGTFYARTFNGIYPGLVDSLYSGINCTGCSPTSGTSLSASLGATTSNINFSLVSGGRISGNVADAFDSSPLPERQVAIYNAAGSVVTFATSDEAGSYTSFHGLVTGSYYALASAGGYFSQLYNGRDCTGCSVTTGNSISVTLGATTTNINFAMHSSQAIVRGRVTDAVTGGALGGVLVVFYNASGQQVLATTSDFVDGSYTIYLPAAGRYYALTQNGLQQDYLNQLYSGIDCSGCAPTSGTQIDVVFGVPFENVNFALRKTGGTISGTILDASTSAPAPFGFVQVFSATGVLAAYGFSDTTGHYSVSDGLTTGDYYVIGRAPNYVPTLYANIPCSTGCTVTAGTPVHVTGGQTTPNINFNLGGTTSTISGHVFAAVSGTPLAGADVGIFDSNGNEISRGTSDTGGNYTVELAHGGTYFARTINTVDATYHDQLWNHLPCEDCDPTVGTPINVADGTATANINFDLLTVACPTITLSPTSLPSTTVGASYNQLITATGGVSPVTFAVTAGSLPAGIGLASNGTLSGSATASGTSAFTITATDANGCAGSANCTISVSAAPTTTTLSVSSTSAVFGTVITFTATVSPASANGNVTFLDGATPVGTAPLAAGSASIQVASLTAGVHSITATYNGSPTHSPSTSAAVQVTISKATPLITWAPPSPITYPTALSSLQLNATANVPGTFVYNPAAGTTFDAGSQTLTTSFTPADTLNYNTASASVTLMVNKADQQIHWSNPADIVYGTPLGPVQLNATVTVPGPSPAGALTYNPPAGTILNAGVNTLTVTAAATVNYNQASASVTITVTKASPDFSDVTAPSIVIGTSSATVTGRISAGTLIPTGSVTVDLNGNAQSAPIQPDGTFSATFATGSLSVGVFPITLTYGGDPNFNSATASSTLTVSYGVSGGVLGAQPSAPGSSLSFRIQILDASGNNLASPAVVVTAYGVQRIGSSTWLPAAPTGNNSPLFRSQNGSYLFTLKTTGLASGDYVLGFTVNGDPTIHTVPFAIR